MKHKTVATLILFIPGHAPIKWSKIELTHYPISPHIPWRYLPCVERRTRCVRRHLAEISRRTRHGFHFIPLIASLFVRAGSSTGEVVLCFRVDGWWPVVTELFQKMHRTSLYYLVLVPQLMGILLWTYTLIDNRTTSTVDRTGTTI